MPRYKPLDDPERIGFYKELRKRYKPLRPEIPGRPDPYAVSIAPQLYDLVFEQLAKPHGLTVEQAVNQLVAVTVETHKEIKNADAPEPV